MQYPERMSHMTSLFLSEYSDCSPMVGYNTFQFIAFFNVGPYHNTIKIKDWFYYKFVEMHENNNSILGAEVVKFSMQAEYHGRFNEKNVW